MSCGAPCAAASFPDPNHRSNGPPGQAISNRRERRRPTFFSRRLMHVSHLAQNPTTMTFRESAILILVLFALYRAFVHGARLYDMFARRDVGEMCRRLTAMQCARRMGWWSAWIGYDWVADTAPWALVAAVSVFFGEEVIGITKRKLKG